MNLLKAAIFFMTVFSLTIASAITSDELLKNCQEAVDDNVHSYLKAGLCYGYIDGFQGMHYNMAYILSYPDTSKGEKFLLFCIPEDVTRQQLAKIIVKYLNDHPEELHYSAHTTLYVIFKKYFPCERDDGSAKKP